MAFFLLRRGYRLDDSVALDPTLGLCNMAVAGLTTPMNSPTASYAFGVTYNTTQMDTFHHEILTPQTPYGFICERDGTNIISYLNFNFNL